MKIKYLARSDLSMKSCHMSEVAVRLGALSIETSAEIAIA